MPRDEGLYRLHTNACVEKYARNDRSGKDCRCMIHLEGQIGTEFIRRSTGTRAWSKAVALAEAARSRGNWIRQEPEPITEPQGITVAEAIAAFLADVESVKGQNLAPGTVRNHRHVLMHLERFCGAGLPIASLEPEQLEAFKQSWTLRSVYSIRTAIQTVKKFCKFARSRGLTDSNPAEWLKAPRIQSIERMPFTEAEEKAIYRACSGKALLLCYVMRFAGLAIIDAANLHDSEIAGDEIRYYRKKTARRENRRRVVVPVPGWLSEELRAVGKGYLFKPEYQPQFRAARCWQCKLARIFRKAGVANATSHRFRHTFATRLLEAGERIEDVSKWLGHSSVQVTERYYSHWTEDRTKAASEKLRRFYSINGHKPV